MDTASIPNAHMFATSQSLGPVGHPMFYVDDEQVSGGATLNIHPSQVLRSTNSYDSFNRSPGVMPPSLQHAFHDQNQFLSVHSITAPTSRRWSFADDYAPASHFQSSYSMPSYSQTQTRTNPPPTVEPSREPLMTGAPVRKRCKGGAGPFPCPDCGRYFQRRADMQRHQRKRKPCYPIMPKASNETIQSAQSTQSSSQVWGYGASSRPQHLGGDLSMRSLDWQKPQYDTWYGMPPSWDEFI